MRQDDPARAADDPAGVVRRFAALLEAGDLDGLMGLYAGEAALVARPGETVHGPEAIREALAPLAALRPAMSGEVVRVVRAGSTALVVNRWSLRGAAPGGGEVRLAGVSADVLRRERDGRWLVAIDDPWGAGDAGAEAA